jgi:two-component system, NtrC family, sensor histidine kinase HydH
MKHLGLRLFVLSWLINTAVFCGTALVAGQRSASTLTAALVAALVAAAVLTWLMGRQPPPQPAADPQGMLSQMASLLAHDLCNALSAVKINLQLLARPHGSRSEQDLERCRVALDQIAHIEQVIADLQAFARPAQLQRVVFDVREAVDAALRESLAPAERKGIELARRDSPGPAVVCADRARLVHVLQQLVSNSIDASPPHACIRLHTETDALGAVVLMVSDEGEGMAADVQRRATEPFFTTKARGTGLGLTIAERLMRAHDGELLIESAPGRGTTVRLRFATVA